MADRDNMKRMNGISVSERINTNEFIVQDPYVEGSAAFVYLQPTVMPTKSHGRSALVIRVLTGSGGRDWRLGCLSRRLKYALQYRETRCMKLGIPSRLESAYVILVSVC